MKYNNAISQQFCKGKVSFLLGNHLAALFRGSETAHIFCSSLTHFGFLISTVVKSHAQNTSKEKSSHLKHCHPWFNGRKGILEIGKRKGYSFYRIIYDFGQTELSSVGRALDCSGCSQQSKGRWFDSGSSDFFAFFFFFLFNFFNQRIQKIQDHHFPL